MTLQECTAILTPLALALRVEMDTPTFKAYHAVLRKAAPHLLRHAVSAQLESGIRFMPSAPELLSAAERVRRQLIAATPYEGCVECEEQRGWRTVLGAQGQKVVERCPCLTQHRERLTSLGVGDALTALPGEAGVGENEQVYPTFEQLPAPIQAKLRSVVNQKALR